MNRFQLETLLLEAREKERRERNETLSALLAERKRTGELRIKGLYPEARAKETRAICL